MGTTLDQAPSDESFGIDNIILSRRKTSEQQTCEMALHKYQWVNLKPECRNNASRVVLSQKVYENGAFRNPCVLQTSSKLLGGQIVKVNAAKVTRSSLAKGMVTFCDTAHGEGKCCKFGDGKHKSEVTKGKCPSNNKISYISVPEGCTAVVCNSKCNDRNKEQHYYLGPGNHTPPAFRDNSISEAHVCVSCFLHTLFVRNYPSNPSCLVQR